MKKNIVAGLLLGALILTPAYSFARFSMTPAFDVREEYNDNIFLDDSGEEDDFITTVRPGIKLQYSPGKNLDLDLDYGLDIRHYSRHSGESEEEHRLSMSAAARPFKGAAIEVTDTYARVPVDIRDAYAEDNTLTNMTDSNVFTASARILFPLTSSLSVSTGYSYEGRWYEDEGNTDSEAHSASVSLIKRFSSKINGTLEYRYNAYRPDIVTGENNIFEYDRHNASAGFEYRISSSLTVNGTAGESWIDYDEQDNDRLTFWSAGADYTFSYASLGVAHSRSLSDSPVSGASKNTRTDLFVKTGKTIEVTLNPYISEDTFINADRKDRIKGVRIDLSRPLGGKMTVGVNGLWEDQEFLPEQEEVTRYSAGCSLDYKVTAKVTAGAGYRYNARDSNVSGEDFTNNIGWLRAQVSF